MDESSGGSGSPRSDKFAVSKVGLLTAVHKVRSAVTHGNRGFRQAFKFKKAAEETLQEHDIRGCHGTFWYLLKDIAKERYCRASRENPNNVINEVLMSFFFLENGMLRARTYAGSTHIGARLMAEAVLNTRAAGPKKHPSRDYQWYTPSLFAVGFTLEMFPAECLKEGDEYYSGCVLPSLDATAMRLQYESLAQETGTSNEVPAPEEARPSENQASCVNTRMRSRTRPRPRSLYKSHLRGAKPPTPPPGYGWIVHHELDNHSDQWWYYKGPLGQW